MATLKKKLKNNFTQTPNKAILDNTISASAFRLYVYLLSRPDNWEVNNADLKNKLNIKSNESIAKYFKELLNSGWIDRQKKQDKNGKYEGGYDYIIYNEIGLKNPNLESFQIRKESKFGNFPKTNINIDSNTNTDSKINIENESSQQKQSEIFNVPKRIEDKKCLFKNSSVAKWEDFKTFFNEEINAGVDVYYYYEITKNWSEGKGKMRKSWIAQAKNIILRDKKDNKVKMVDNGDSTKVDYLNL